MQSPDDVLKFWFEDHGRDDWFAGKPEFDEAVRARFAATHEAVSRGEAYGWRATPGGRLAEIIVLDQFSRQLHRGTARAFAQDGMALVLAQEAIAHGIDKDMDESHRLFLYMPFQHSESLAIQGISVRLFQGLANEELLKYALGHFEVIRRFGRFCKRNAALGRESTPEELQYIETSEGVF